LLGATAAACGSDRPPVQSCTDPLAGVWHLEGGDDRYEAIDAGRTIELHPLFDSAAGRPGASAAAFSFVRGAGEIQGSYLFWLTEQDGVRRVRWPAKLVRCASNRLVVAYRKDGASWVQIAFARE